LFIRNFTWEEVPEGEVTVHDGVLILDFDAILIYTRLLMMPKEAGKLAHDAVPSG